MPPTTAELFEAALRLHSRRLLAIARAIAGNRACAEDVVQQALANLYQHRDRYDWADPAAAGALLRRAVVNEALRLLRQPRMAQVTDDHPAGAIARGERGAWAERGGGLERLIDRETVARVRQALDRLPEHFRAALVLCEYENMAYVQIAEVLGASVPQVKTWLHRGRRQLALMLQDFMAPERPKPTLAPDDPASAGTNGSTGTNGSASAGANGRGRRGPVMGRSKQEGREESQGVGEREDRADRDGQDRRNRLSRHELREPHEPRERPAEPPRAVSGPQPFGMPGLPAIELP